MSFESERHLLEAINQCQLRKLIQLIRHGRNIHVRNQSGQNLLVYILQQQKKETNPSTMNKRFRLFRYLINEENLNIDRCDVFGRNLLNWATNLNCSKESLYLLSTFPGGLDILKRDQFGSCSLHYAVEHGNEPVVRAMVDYLVRYRLRFDIKDAFQNSPEDLARNLGHEQLANYLGEIGRTTSFMSREFPPIDPIRISTGKSRSTDSPDHFSLFEKRIMKAKSRGDWKTVTELRTTGKNSPPKLTLPAIEKLPIFPRKSSGRTSITSTNETEKLFQIFQTQITSSFRRPFILNNHRLSTFNINSGPMHNDQRKLSQASSRRLSSLSGSRKRDSQLSPTAIGTIQERVSVSSINKQHRQSVITMH